MRFTYTPEGAEPQVFNFRPNRLMNVESEKLEELTGWTYQEFGERFMGGSMKAYHALLYIFLKRGNPTLKYDQVAFCADEVEVSPDPDELRTMIEAMEASEDLLNSEQRIALASLKTQYAALEPEGKAVPTAE